MRNAAISARARSYIRTARCLRHRRGLTRLGAACLCALLLLPALERNVAHAASTTDAQISRLEHEVERLEGARAIKHLQRAYGFYMDRALFNEAADLFAPDATVEIGADGVYVGRERIREYLHRLAGGGTGLPWGRLMEHYQLQPVVHVAADGLSGQARWRDLGLLGEYGKSAAWSEGLFENRYVKRDGVWMIQSLHLYVNFTVPYAQGWSRAREDNTDQRSEVARAFPPDRPATQAFKRFPANEVVPFHYENPARAAAASSDELARTASDPDLARYARLAARLQDQDDIENLQGVFGYYFDRNLWDDVANLFSANATFEHGQQGVYRGRKRIRDALLLFGPAGPQRGWLNTYMQLQPVIHVADDGRTAKGRWEGMMQLARPNTAGAWGLGVYENEYVKEGGRWKLSKLHFYVTAIADYDLMWNKGPIPLDGPSTLLPPDQPPTEIYRSLPGVYLPAFHYKHPVTGQPIVTEPQPADSIVRPAPGASK